GEVVIVEDEEGLPILTVIVKCQRGADGVSQMIGNLPSNTRIKHMETRDSQDGSPGWMDVLVELELELGRTAAEAMEAMKGKGLQFYEVSQTMKPPTIETYIEPGSNDAITGSQWFPKTIYDLDICAKRVIMYGAGLDADHPQTASIQLKMREQRLRWYGHVRSRSQNHPVRIAVDSEVEGKRLRGAPKKRWSDAIKKDLSKVTATKEEALDRTKWRRLTETSDPATARN
ncbi:hypothetical protein TELCIR_16787, partial [Teladorsagia circumcincta]